jgi:nucleotide-binding universal stress UspA family protein
MVVVDIDGPANGSARLFVVGSRKFSPLSALALGSVPRREISRAHCPVAVMASGSVS